MNRLGADSIQVLDPQRGFITPPNGVLSVGNGTDARDIVFVNANKAYVSRLGSPKLLIIDPTTLQSTGELDLSQLVKPTDSDGSPDPAYMLIRNRMVYVALQHIDVKQSQLPTVARGEVVVIDPTTDRIVTVITSKRQRSALGVPVQPNATAFSLAQWAILPVNEDGIEAINPDTNTVDTQFAVQKRPWGGDITAFVIVSRTKGFAIVSDANFANSLITFDPSSEPAAAYLVGPLNVLMPHLASIAATRCI